jgi:hypothetical protein
MIGQEPNVTSSYQLNSTQLNSWPNMEFLNNIITEWRRNVEYLKIILYAMMSCCGNTNTKCGNTIKTIWGRVFQDFKEKVKNI